MHRQRREGGGKEGDIFHLIAFNALLLVRGRDVLTSFFVCMG